MLLSRKQFLGFAHSPARKEGSWASFHSNQRGSRDVFFSFPSGEVRAIEELLCAELEQQVKIVEMLNKDGLIAGFEERLKRLKKEEVTHEEKQAA